MGTQSVLHTQGQGGELSFLFHHHWIVVRSEETGGTWDAELNLEAVDALGGEKWTWRREVNSEETWTRE
jgi:hypothetical protein